MEMHQPPAIIGAPNCLDRVATDSLPGDGYSNRAFGWFVACHRELSGLMGTEERSEETMRDRWMSAFSTTSPFARH